MLVLTANCLYIMLAAIYISVYSHKGKMVNSLLVSFPGDDDITAIYISIHSQDEHKHNLVHYFLVRFSGDDDAMVTYFSIFSDYQGCCKIVC